MIYYTIITCNNCNFLALPHWNLGNLSPFGLWNLIATNSHRTKAAPLKMPPTRNRKGKVTVSKLSCSAGTIEKSSKPLL